ncbi:MAG TPA: GatB/YqeY domain-containing protein [Bacteroidia bacterium]|jgi:uncharacterized protein YqeY|nr:GatB/YqeY domain-containing protein [Bacteroidia bacterium]
MTLEEKINAEIKAAMLAKNSEKLNALRAIKSEILLLKSSEKGTSDDAETKAMMKMVKQRKESADIYKEQNRPELAEAELMQVAVIESFLPKQMSADELTAAIKAIMTQVGASTPADMGKVMGVATKQLAGKAEGRAISEMVKKMLSDN